MTAKAGGRRMDRVAARGLAALLSIGVALFSYRYLVPVGPLAANVTANPFALPWLAIHVAGAATALLIGIFQFLPRLRTRAPGVHRWIGRTYVLACTFGGVSGLMLAFGSIAGPIAAGGFGLLALLWVSITVHAWRLAVNRRFAQHREWMIRSWALTFAAVTLRLYLPLAPLLGVDFMVGYRAIAWLCWVPNLIAAELYLRATRRAVRG